MLIFSDVKFRGLGFGSDPSLMNPKSNVAGLCFTPAVHRSSYSRTPIVMFLTQWQIFRTSPDTTFAEPTCLSASPPNAPPRQSKRQGQRTKRPVAVYNLCLELEEGKALIGLSARWHGMLTAWQSHTLWAVCCASVSVLISVPSDCNVLD